MTVGEGYPQPVLLDLGEVPPQVGADLGVDPSQGLGLGAVVAEHPYYWGIQVCKRLCREGRDVVTGVEYEFDSLLLETLNGPLDQWQAIMSVRY